MTAHAGAGGRREAYKEMEANEYQKALKEQQEEVEEEAQEDAREVRGGRQDRADERRGAG